ncbi:MAG: hypothetical protein QXW35_05480 [Candidatus Aenigmatarchaeota archaeon]
MTDHKKIQELELKIENLEEKIELLEREITSIRHTIEQDKELYRKLLDKIDEFTKTSTELKIAIEKLTTKFDKDLELLNQRTNIDYIYQTVMHRLFNEGAIDKQIPGLFMKLLIASTTIVTILVFLLDKVFFRN